MLLPSGNSLTPKANPMENDNATDGSKPSSIDANHTGLPVPNPAANGGANGSSSSNSLSKQSSHIGLGLSTGSAITSALPNLSLAVPGSSKSVSSAKPNSPGAGGSHGNGATPASRLVGLVGKVEPKGDTGFTVYVGDRAVVYNVDTHAKMTEWVDRLKEALGHR